MSRRLHIPSLLAADERVFLISDSLDDLWDSHHRTTRPLGLYVGYFPTLGDGFTQHGPAQSCPAGMIQDFVLSATAYALHSGSDDDDSILTTGTLNMGHLNTDSLRFLTSVRYSEKKQRFFSFSELKVSSNPNLRFDKRYFEVTAEYDGSFEGTFKLLLCPPEQGGRSNFDMLFLICRALDLATAMNVGSPDYEVDRVLGLKALNLGEEYPEDTVAMVRALRYALDAKDQRMRARNMSQCYLENILRLRAKQANSPAAVALAAA